MKIKKCQSKKHVLGGCGAKNCPEGMSIKQAMSDAVDNGDVAAYLEARSFKKVKPVAVYSELGQGYLYLKDTKTGETGRIPFSLSRPDIQQQVRDIDKENIPSFDSINTMKDHLEDLYGDELKLQIFEKQDSKTGTSLVIVGNMSVSADLRGMGIGTQVRQMLIQFSNENNSILCGTPTNRGDGVVDRSKVNDAEWKQEAVAHRERLIRFYQEFGYELNHCFKYAEPNDSLTGELYQQDEEKAGKFSDDGRKFLENVGTWIKWPNGKIPEALLRK